MESFTTDDTILLISMATLLLLVMIILLNRRSNIYKKYRKTEAELTEAKIALARLKHKKTTTPKVAKPVETTSRTQIEPSKIYSKPLDKLQHSLEQMATLYNEGAASNITIMPVLNKAIFYANMMQQTTDELALILKLQTAKITLKPANLRHELTRLYTENSTRVSEAGLKLNIDISSKISTTATDVDLLRKLLNELMRNAIAFTKAGQITIKAAEVAGSVKISVVDTGIGIRNNEQESIFELQHRSRDSRVADTPGSGVGLYMCRVIAQKLGGELAVKSRLSHGSEFILTLPRKD